MIMANYKTICSKCASLMEENYESCPVCGGSLIDEELKRLKELESAVIEFVSLTYRQSDRELASWRETLRLLVDQEQYNSIKKLMKEAVPLLSHIQVFRLNQK